MYPKEADELYDEMCRIVGDTVFTLHDLGHESKQVVIADALRTALVADKGERSTLSKSAMQLAIKTLET